MISNTWKKILLGIALFAVLFHTVLWLSGTTYLYKALWYNYVDLDDYTIFANDTIAASSVPLTWPQKISNTRLSDTCTRLLDSLETKAVLVIQDDSVVYEKYWDHYTATTKSNSFSVAKSFVSALVGMALREGKIKSLDQKVGEYLPEFSSGKKSEITLRHLLTMSSGLDWDESYAAPISTTTESYYGTDLKGLISGLRVIEAPGMVYRYKGSDTQLLAMVLEKATGKSLSENMQQLAQILGFTEPALWSKDREDGIEKAYCCLNSNARDFARLGSLYLKSGYWNGKQILDSAFVEASIRPNGLRDGDGDGSSVKFYGYQWWCIPEEKAFYARGILGQYIVVLPEKNMVVVRLGASRGAKIGKHYQETRLLIREVKSW
ncbi:MAG: beta-lactamase family protein [Cytophagaceae bacterium]|jgi:CubicO group peptidase (beta-lactamase class C family)|nr:beta-lactamase family protein [Cytophagaceae bacterium]